MTAGVGERYRVEPLDVRASSEHELRQVAKLIRALMRERVPEDPEAPLAYLIARIRAIPGAFKRLAWIAKANGALVGRALAWRRRYGTNQTARNVEIEVLPEHRRRGIARMFLREIVRAAGEDASVVFSFISTDRIPAGEAFMRRLGAEAGMAMTTNQLDLAIADRALLERWRSAAPRGYRLEWIDGDVPERLVDSVVAAYNAMANTPTGTLRIWDFTATRETVRSFEHARREQRHLLVLAIDETTGETAGFTEVNWHPSLPHLIQQGGTAVVEKHQGKGLGKRLKAAMLERVLAERREASYVRTNNNPANPPIIAINERLGFRPAWTNTVWQLPIADARRYLEGAPT